MMKYKSKMEIEAIQFMNNNLEELCQFCRPTRSSSLLDEETHLHSGMLELEGTKLFIEETDWLVKSENNNVFGIWKDSDFKEHFEEIKDGNK